MSSRTRKIKKIITVVISITGIVFVIVSIIAKKKKGSSVYDDDEKQKNPLEAKKVIFVEDEEDEENADGVRGHLVAVGDSNLKSTIYDKYVKRSIDVVLSFAGLLILSPIMGLIALAIKIEDPGPVLFTQKRMGQNKQYFKLHKFRSMRLDTPHDVPTHQLDNPEQYITKVGAFIRAHSLDELPQIWDIFIGNMSVIGPRPGLWNQDLLTAERDKYCANDVKPGLTGWAQINGRDELEIPEKARLDGEYVKNKGLLFDIKCFLGTVGKVRKDDSVVEGGTGNSKRQGRNYIEGKKKNEIIGNIGFGEKVVIDYKTPKKVLITGSGSYIGENFKKYAEKKYQCLAVDTVDMLDDSWRKKDFSEYDIVYHVAGLAHADVGNVDEETKEKYYKVNTDLAIEVCKKAKEDGVNEFIFMSSMIVYGESAPYRKKYVITKNTVPNPVNFYGDSKLQADVAVRQMATEKFKVIVIRPPMIYGKESKGNYPILAKLSKKMPVFPSVSNNRSMLYIENLCELLSKVMMINEFKKTDVVLMPQNSEWTNTSDLVETISKVSGKKIITTKLLAPIVWICGKMPGKIGGLVNKAFGNFCYSHSMSIYEGIDYHEYDLKKSIACTEGKGKKNKKHILVISQYFYPEQFRVNDICKEWITRGYDVTVVTGIPNYPEGEFYEGYDHNHNRQEEWNGVKIIRLPIRARKTGKINMALNYLSFVVEGRKWIKKNNVNADRVFIYEVSPMTQALVGVWYAKRNNVKCSIYVTDLWPENVEIVLGIKNKLLLLPIEIMVDYIYRNCEYIFTSSRSFVDRIASRGVAKDKIIFWPQYAEDFYVKKDKERKLEIFDDGNLNLTFAGNIGTAQGLDVLIGAAKILKDRKIKIHFNIIGNGRYEKEFRKKIKDASVGNYFVFIPRQNAERIPEYFAWSDGALITLEKNEIYKMTIPAKTQSCLACGIPILVCADGEVQTVIKEAECGFVCDSGDAFALAENIEKMIKLSEEDLIKMSKNAINYYKSNFDKKMLMDKMEKYI